MQLYIFIAYLIKIQVVEDQDRLLKEQEDLKQKLGVDLIGCTLFNTLLEVINNMNINFVIGCTLFNTLLEVINNMNINFVIGCTLFNTLLEVINNMNINL